MIKAAIVGDPNRVPNYLLERIPKTSKAVQESMSRLLIKLQRKIKTEKLMGQILKERTGKLKQSVHYSVQTKAYNVTGSVFTNKEYAAIHEYGGVTKAHWIKAKHKKALFFQWQGGFNPFSSSGNEGEWRFFKKVWHPGSKMPERSFMRSALKEMGPEIETALNKALAEIFK